MLLKIARGTDVSGPDLGAVVLAPPIAGSIGSIKSFYNLDKRRDQILRRPPDLRMGTWVAQGFIEEQTIVAPLPHGRGARVTFNGGGLFGYPEIMEKTDGYDYLDYPVSPLARQMTPSLPSSRGGMSGSGLGQILLQSKVGNPQADDIEYDAPFLSGFLFRQRKVDGEMWITCHGPTSVYDKALKVIQECGA